ncbi:MAG TPA: hypothetical protein VH593_07095 [Ktedonobacteraceae bacterium]
MKPQKFALESEEALLRYASYYGIEVKKQENGSYRVIDTVAKDEHECKDFFEMEALLWEKIP